MGWGASVEEEKLRFVADWKRGGVTMVGLCESYGVSRQTGYELLRRYEAEGLGGLRPRSRAPHRPGRAMGDEVAAAILELRRERPSWGPKKLRAVLIERRPEIVWPAPSSMGELLRREGLSASKRRRSSAIPVARPFAPVAAANDLWCIDFKGWFRTRDGTRCDPLTVTDAHSRCLLDCRILSPTRDAVQPAVDRLFRAFGLPVAIRSDNGPPFASTGAAGLSRLAVHWLKLGIALERIDPGAPQQNGRHERMHATLKAETARPPAETAADQQARFDAFRSDFNENRPHEALGQVPPIRRYEPSPRPFPDKIEEPWYDPDHAVRRVRPTGEIKWGGSLVFVSEALAGETVGVAETEAGDWIVRFAAVDLGLIDRASKKLRRFASARPCRGKAKPKPTGESVNHVSGP
jgi:transposase InsO family protein